MNSVIPFELLHTLLRSDEVLTLAGGKSTHVPAMSLIKKLIRFNQDVEWHKRLIKSCLPTDYAGNTLEEVPAMVAWALEHQGPQAKIYDPGSEGPIPQGYSGADFIFRHQVTKELFKRTATQLTTPGTLLELAAKGSWEKNFPRIGPKGQVTGINVMDAADALIQACRRAGYRDVSSMRGVGVWTEDDRIVVNRGGEEIKSDKYVYSAPPGRLKLEDGDVPLGEIMEFLRTPNWKTPSAPELLLGACAAGVICGALSWRPHIGITGPTQSGKTTILSGISDILAPFAIKVEGTSTEAGIRQRIGHDALPIISDEMELETSHDGARVSKINKLMRSASSAAGDVARGTQDGRGFSYNISCMFIVGAINLYSSTAADSSRMVRLELEKPKNPRETGTLIRSLGRKLRGIGPRFCSRVVNLAPAILASIPKLHLHLQVTQERQADNMATLLAAYGVMMKGAELTDDEARELALKHAPAVEAQQETFEVDDSTEALNVLLGFTVKVDLGNSAEPQSVGQVLALAFANKTKFRESQRQALQQIGIKIESKGFLVANSHPGLRDVYRGSRWQEGMWGSALARLDGALAVKQRRFSDGVRSRGVLVPKSFVPPLVEAGKELMDEWNATEAAAKNENRF